MDGRARFPTDPGSPHIQSRDRYIDLLRVVSLSMVVLGHWLAVMVTFEDGTVTGENALNAVPDMWPLTWLFQVMPLFFFVGGFANRRSYESVCRRGGGYVSYVTRRLERLLIPTLAFLAVGLTAATILDAAGVIEDLLRPAARVVTLPLWFLGLYLMVLAVAPLMLALHRKFGLGVVLTLGCGAVVVDLVRFGLDVESIGFLNYGFVWLLVHQLGFLYPDGLIQRFGGLLALTGAGLLVASVALGPYPNSLVGIAGDEIDNMNPPTLAILALAGWEIGVALIVRSAGARWLERRRVWGAVVVLNLRIMTMFLWHLAAILPTIAVIYPLGFPQPDPGSVTWWLLRPAWILLQIPALFVLVVVFGRFEAMGRRFAGDVHPSRETAPGQTMAALGAFYAGLAVVGFARLGLEPVYSDLSKDVTIIDVNSARSSIHLLLALFLLRAASLGPRAPRAAPGAAAALAVLALAGELTGGLLSTTRPETVLHAASAIVLAAVAASSASMSSRETS